MNTTTKRRSPRGRVEVGERFVRWTVIGEAGYPYVGARHVLCRCECGRVRAVPTNNLLYGRSGGCLACMGARRRKPPKTCQKCGVTIHRKSRVCRQCFGLSRFGRRQRPWLYPESIGTVGDRFGVSKQRVHQLVKERGFDGAVAYLTDRYGEPKGGA